MSHLTRCLSGLFVLSSVTASAAADQQEAIRAAIARGLPVIEQAARNYPSHRQCYSCHHQTLPMMAMADARRAGFAVDEELFGWQREFTWASFAAKKSAMEQGTGIGGRAFTVAYGLWTFLLADHPPDAVTTAMVTYLLKTQQPDGYWKPSTHRPPLEESAVSNTVFAIYGLQHYATKARQAEADACIEKTSQGLETAECHSQEDRAFLLWARHLLGADSDAIQQARQAVLDAQREDGGWSQLPDMASDAYATGQTLFILQETGFPTTVPEFQRGVQFLLDTQLADGSWHVVTRSKPIQVYFDNGDPHGKDQFISIPATSWAISALARALTKE